MKYDFLIIGAGYVGGSVARDCRARNQTVAVLIHSSAIKSTFSAEGIDIFLGDITSPQTLNHVPAAKNVLIAVAPTERDIPNYQKIYVEGVGNVLKCLSKASVPPERILYLSSTGVYGDRKGDWVDEATPPNPDNSLGQILLEAEHQVLTSKLPAMVLRLSGIYGPGRNRWLTLREGESERYINMIHLGDIVRLTALLFERGETGEVYLGTDDEPVLRSEFYRWLGFDTQTLSNPTHFLGKRCRNNKLKSLGFLFAYPTFREGYQALKETE